MTKLIALLLSMAAVLVPSAGTAHDHAGKVIEIDHAWAPAMAEPENKATPVYLIIKNRSGASDRLIGARASVAGGVEIHDAGNAPKSVATLAIGTGEDLELSSVGPHLYLTGVNRQLQLHDSFKMALEFERSGRVVVDVNVEDPAIPDGSAHHHHAD